MKISTKGRYALRVLVDLAEQESGKNVSIREIALRQGISEKYLEGIVSRLSNAGFVKSMRGKYGGYQLAKDPKESTVYDILASTEDSMALISCLEKGISECERSNECRTLPFWVRTQEYINDYLRSKTLEDVIKGTF